VRRDECPVPVTRTDPAIGTGSVTTPPPLPPLVLIASIGQWMSRSFETVFELHGYTVVRVESGTRALEAARLTKPDAVLLDECGPDLDAVDVCRALRDDPSFDPTTPIVITADAHAAPRVRAAAYEAGAWEYCSQPLDIESLLLKLKTFLRARQELAAMRSRLLIDPGTGLYTSHGLETVAAQLGARATRNREPFACVALTPRLTDRQAPSSSPGSDAADAADAFADVADVCRALSRRSDVVGYVGGSRLAILAPDTDATGARLLVERLQRALDEHPAPLRTSRTSGVRAGYCGVSDLAAAGVNPSELVRRAASALDHLQLGGDAGGILSFDEVPGA
jgi:PleD family two-component response regulator